jgi:hypothetical protein
MVPSWCIISLGRVSMIRYSSVIEATSGELTKVTTTTSCEGETEEKSIEQATRAILDSGVAAADIVSIKTFAMQ